MKKIKLLLAGATVSAVSASADVIAAPDMGDTMANVAVIFTGVFGVTLGIWGFKKLLGFVR